MRRRGKLLGCTPSLWERTATECAEQAGVCPVKVLAGVRAPKYRNVRWGAWRKLVDADFSYLSIALASGFDHATVRNATDDKARIKNIENNQARFCARKISRTMPVCELHFGLSPAENGSIPAL